MPGCLGLDAMWQLIGFFLAWSGHRGMGRALGVEEVRFTGEVLPKAKLVTYQIDVKRVIARKLVMVSGDGSMRCRRSDDLHRQGAARRRVRARGLLRLRIGREACDASRRRHRHGRRVMHRQRSRQSSRSLAESRSGIRTAPGYAELGLRSQVAGIPQIELEKHLDRRDLRFMGDAAAYAAVSMKQAIADSGLTESRSAIRALASSPAAAAPPPRTSSKPPTRCAAAASARSGRRACRARWAAPSPRASRPSITSRASATRSPLRARRAHTASAPAPSRFSSANRT